jgi:hypothetical protein
MTPSRLLDSSRLQPLGVITTVRRELHRLDIVQALSMLCETRNMNIERTSTPTGVHIKQAFTSRTSIDIQKGLLARSSSICYHDLVELEKVMGLAPLVLVTKGLDTIPSSKFWSKPSPTALHRSHVKRDGEGNRSRLGTAY